MGQRRKKSKPRDERERREPEPPTHAPATPAVTPEQAPDSRARRLARLGLLAVVLLALVVYSNSLANGLVWDGHVLLNRIPNVRDPLDLKAVFLEAYRLKSVSLDDDDTGEGARGGAYRPFTTWSLAWVYAANEAVGLDGAHPFAHHLVNVALFGAVTGLVFSLARGVLGLARLPALAAAALFAVHPIHGEVVAEVVGRAELLAALFGLLLLRAHARGARPWTCAALYGAALLGKESAASFMAVTVAYDLLIAPAGTWRQRLWHYASYVLVGVVWWWGLRAAARGDAATTTTASEVANVLAHVGRRTAFLTALRVQLDYLLLQAVPVGMAVDYSYPQIRPVETVLDLRVLSFLAVLGGALAMAWELRRTRPRVALAIVAYAALFAPTSNLVIKIGTIMGDRLAFAPSIFFCLLVGEAVDALRARARWPRRIGVAVVLCVFAAITVRRNHVWHDAESFSLARVREAPENAAAHYNEARRLQQAGERERALHHFRRTLELYPGSGLDVAGALEDLGEEQEAMDAYRLLLERYPRLLPALQGLLSLLIEEGRLDEARALVDETGRRAPNSLEHAVLQFRLQQALGEPTGPAGPSPLAPPPPLPPG